MSMKLIPEELHDEPNTVKLVYLALEEHGPLTRRELASHTGLCPNHLDRQFSTLREAGLLDVRKDWKDRRRSTYEVET